MAATLTFEIGRRPGIRCRKRLVRRHAPGMTAAQRAALGELVREPAVPPPRSAQQAKTSRLDFVWPAVLALAFLLGGRALFEGVRFLHSADASQAKLAQPQVDVTIARLPATTDPVQARAPIHSSTAANRTM